MILQDDTPDDTSSPPEAPAKPDIQPHPVDERCYDCATDDELMAALSGQPHPTIHFGDGTRNSGACPFNPPAATR